MDRHGNTPPYMDPQTSNPDPENGPSSGSVKKATSPTIPSNVTQALVDANVKLKRFQQDLLVLTSFNENETLHWRPSWFTQEPHSKGFWTLYNPPNVVTERLPHPPCGRLVYTRRMRRPGDPSAMYPQTWDQWNRLCDMSGVPRDLLCEDQVKLIRLGLHRDDRGIPCAPPNYPLYPEPQPRRQGRYMLTPEVYKSHLPCKFKDIRTTGPVEAVQVVVVHSDGALRVEQREQFFQHASQWTRYTGQGGYVRDGNYIPDMTAPRDQAKGRRWSYVPWTKEQDESCKAGLKIKLRLWNSARQFSKN
ncbi:hypothetical protein GQ44DRAFT_714614 [Phaeosphaeriaceae sp. PMI808]|nr:hypothetical protein GQ44DRAFT_714614 [Phaeosphaeriaceae sp. PMI808]